MEVYLAEGTKPNATFLVVDCVPENMYDVKKYFMIIIMMMMTILLILKSYPVVMAFGVPESSRVNWVSGNVIRCKKDQMTTMSMMMMRLSTMIKMRVLDHQ